MATNKPKRTWEIWEILLIVLVAFLIGFQVGRSHSFYELGERVGYGLRRLIRSI